MSNTPEMARRELLAAAAGAGVGWAVFSTAHAQPNLPPAKPGVGHDAKPAKPAGEAHDAAPAAPLSAAHVAVIDATAACLRAGRTCLARCTDHLAAGSPMMEHCQRAVMNMLAVVGAMADVAGYANASPKEMKLLAHACAQFCRVCAQACEPHAAHHAECKACLDSCNACAKACDAL